ncbi:MAG: lipoprotein [Treponema sp.]|nr:lipoprotein [Treponema sp.]
MKKIGLVLATFVVLLASCSNLNLQSRSSEFGSLVLSNEEGGVDY